MHLDAPTGAGGVVPEGKPMRRSSRLVVVLLCLALLSSSGLRSQDAVEEVLQEPVWLISSRPVVVTDSQCGADGVTKDHRRCALERASEGFALIFFEPVSAALYTIEYPSEKLRIQVLNDFAGLPAFAQGRWDDENHVVKLSAIYPPPQRGPTLMLREEAP